MMGSRNLTPEPVWGFPLLSPLDGLSVYDEATATRACKR